MEGDAREDEADNHARGGDDHDLAAADYVDVLQREKREDEVRARDDEADGCGLVEADLLEECGWTAHTISFADPHACDGEQDAYRSST